MHFPALIPLLALVASITGPDSADCGPVRIMTWNIRYDNPDDGIHAWPRRRDSLLSFILSEKPDILCIQEGLRDQVLFLENGLRTFDVRGVGRDDGKEKGEYAAIYFNRFRFRCEKGGTFWLSPTPSVPGKGWDAALPRIVTWVRLIEGPTNKALYVFNTHFDHQGTDAREQSARLLRSKILEIAGSTAVVAAGDFNSAESETPYRILTSSDFPPPRLQDAIQLTGSPHQGPPGTFTGFEPAEADSGQRIDYLFVAGPIRVMSHRTCVAKGPAGFLSDHLPVEIEICYPHGD